MVFNPAALLKNIKDLPRGGTVIADPGNFDKRHQKLVGLTEEQNPLIDGTLDDYQVHTVEIGKLTQKRLRKLASLRPRAAAPTSSRWAWRFGSTIVRSIRPLLLDNKFRNKPQIIDANTRALKAGYHYG